MSKLIEDLSSFPSTASTSLEGRERISGSTSSGKLRVTLLSSEWRSTKGGLSTINRELAIQLAKHPSVEVSVYLPQCREEDKRVAARHNVHLIEAEEIPGYDNPVDWLSFLPEDHAPDFMIGHGVILGRQVQNIKRHHLCKWIQVVHAAPEELGMYKSYADAISRGEKKYQSEVKLCEKADQVVAVGPKLSEAFSGYLRAFGKDQDVLNLTPGIFSEFADVKQVTGERKTFSVLVFGRGENEDFQLKGFDIASRAIAELKNEPQPYKLLFVGAPSGKEEKVKDLLLQQGIDRSQLTVRCSNESREQLDRLFCEVDLAIMPTRTEEFGLVALEALSAGLPVLVSGNSGLGEALKEVPYGFGFVVESEDPRDWAQAIKAVRHKDREIRLGECKVVCAAYAEKYSWKEQCYKLVERMKSITLEEPRGPAENEARNRDSDDEERDCDRKSFSDRGYPVQQETNKDISREPSTSSGPGDSCGDLGSAVFGYSSFLSKEVTSLHPKSWLKAEDVVQLAKLSIVSEPSVKSAYKGESVEGPKDDNSKNSGEVPMASASGMRKIRAATMMFEAKHEECIRVLPYIKDGQIVVQFYVYSGESGVPKDLEEEAQQFFKEMNVKLEWSDLYNNSVNVLKVQRLVYSSGKPKTLTASQVDEMNDVIEKNLPELSKHRNITSVQASFKIKNSTQTDEPCITLYVLGKGFFPIGEPKFPKAFGDYPVDVVNGFWTRASGEYWEPNSAQKPSKTLCSGVSIGVQGKEAAGTLGAIVKNGSTFYALSSHHVMNSEQSNLIVHPSLYDHLNYLRYYLAQYRRHVKDVTGLEAQGSVNDFTTREALVNNFKELKFRKDIHVQGYSTERLELIEMAEKDFEQGQEPPREIGERVVGVFDNFLWTDGKKYFIDAAIAKLFDEEVKKLKGTTARLIGNDGKPRGCSPVDKIETILKNRLCKSGRTTVYTEIENKILRDKNHFTTPHYMIGSPSYDLSDLPFISNELKEFICKHCEVNKFEVTDSREPLSCVKCHEQEASFRMGHWLYRVLCISEGKKVFADEGDSGAVIFEIDQTEGDEKFLSGLGLFFATGVNQYHRLTYASPLKIVLDALTKNLPTGTNLELVSKF